MNQDEPKWRVIERVVKLIEKSLSPDARVEHNVSLPDLTSSVGSKRQCDIVIWSGRPPRETRTIVEVQNRNEKVDINTFDGWCKKMERVGAQHLICVSTKGFPKSIKAEAIKRGPTVRLVTLAELERNQWPINIVENCLEYVAVLPEKTKFDKITMIRLEKGNLLRMNYRKREAPHFQYAGQDFKLSINDLIHIHVIESDLSEGIHKVEFVLPKPGQRLYYLEGNQRITLNHIGIAATLEIERGKIPLTFSSYIQSSHTQADADQSIAWIMTAVGVFRGEEIDIRAIFLPDNEGVLRLAQVSDATGNNLFFRFIPVSSKS